MSRPDATQLLQRPKRADARRNYDALVAAARDAFAEQRDVALEDVARRAGVGIGTLYRNFPTRAALVEAVYVEEVERLARAGDTALLDDGDAWEALTGWLRGFVRLVVTKQALAEELFAGGADRAVFAGCRGALTGAGAPLLERAQGAGLVRGDLTAEDVIKLVAGIAKIPAEPAEVQRLLGVALDGLRAR